MKILDKILNHKITKINKSMPAGVYLIFGQRGSGKSCLFAKMANDFTKLGITCFSNYPVDNTYSLPYKNERITNKQGKLLYVTKSFDKEFLYNYKFSNCVVFIDEAKPIWPNRGYKDWTQRDDDFINYLRKNNVILMLATQYYDGLDLNLRRSCNEFIYMRQGYFKNIARCEIYESEIVPVANRELDVKSGLFKKPFSLITFEIGALLQTNCLFYRKPYYEMFDTNFYYDIPKSDPPRTFFENVKYLGVTENV